MIQTIKKMMQKTCSFAKTPFHKKQELDDFFLLEEEGNQTNANDCLDLNATPILIQALPMVKTIPAYIISSLLMEENIAN